MFFAGLYLWSYILLMVFLLLNMFIAIAVHVLMRQQTDGPSPTASAPAAVRSPHSIFGFWWPRHFISTRASDCLTLMEGIPWIEKVDLGVRLEKVRQALACLSPSDGACLQMMPPPPRHMTWAVSLWGRAGWRDVVF